MRRFCILFACILCCCSLCLPVAAASHASSVQSTAIVSPDGSCQISTTITIHLDATPEELAFPLPKEAENILLNGGSVTTRPHKNDSSAVDVLLPGIGAGDYTFHLSYQLPLVVSAQENSFTVDVPLLSGFAYPISSMEFTVTLPDAISHRPAYVSGYHQEGIEGILNSTVTGNTLSCSTTEGLKDHETLKMTLKTDPEMFPHLSLQEPLLSGWDGAALVCIALAVIYYLICLLPVVPRRVRSFSPPEGISAGEVGTCLTGCGADLTMMVLTWAQLGYIRIDLDRGNKVTLHKQMDMGNERSDFEVKIFGSLFKNRASVAGSSYHYARLCRKVATKSPLLRQLFLPSSGNPRIFRFLAGLAGAFSGVSLAISVSDNAAVQILLGILFCLLCSSFSYFLQAGGKCLPLRDKSQLYIGLACGGLWLCLGLLIGEFGLVLPMVVFQFISGVAAAYGGRRSERGKRCLAELRSLRSFMTSTQESELQRMLQGNPNYFYELAPYALAMGVEKKFAKRFGRMPLPDQSFLNAHTQRELTAGSLMGLLGNVVDSLNALQKRLPYERLRGK